VLLHNNAILLMRQNNRSFWVYPGGTLEANETVSQCAIRELHEEASLAIELDGLLAVTNFADARRQVVDVTYVGHCTQPPPGVFTPPFVENINEIVWVPLSELKHYPVEPQALHQHIQHCLTSDASLKRHIVPILG
jgi:ADP-ribose pyrophosphatase YjhB (NUDIX family)